MKKLLSLIRVGLRVNFGLSVLRQRVFKEKKDIWLVFVIVLGFGSLVPLGMVYLDTLKKAYELLVPVGQQHLILLFGILAGQLFVLIFGLYYVVSTFYFSNDLEILIPLPLEPFQVMLSKFAVVLVNEYLSLIPLVLPVFIYFGVLSKAGPGYWVQSALVYLLIPVIPLTAVSMLVVGMMRVINLSRKKDLLIIVGTLFLMAVVFGAQTMMGRAAGSKDIEATIRMLASPDGLVNRAGAGFPPSIWATKAIAGGLSGSGLFHLMVLAGVSLLLLYAVLMVSEKLFYRGLIGIGETTARKRSLSEETVSRMIPSRGSPFKAILAREFRIMNRTPIFLLNGIGAVVLLPALLLFVSHTGGKGDASLLNVIQSSNPQWVVLGAACFLTVCACLNGTSSSTFSREGSLFWMSKVIPVSPRIQVVAKFAHSYSVALLGAAAASIVLIVSFRPKADVCAEALLLALVASFALTAISMMVDLARPLLDWTNPQKAIKQNLNVLFAMLIEIAIIILLGFFSRALIKTGMRMMWLVGILLGVLVLLSASAFTLLLRFADRRYIEIEL